MKKLGLIGGTSWASTVDYYRLLNETINQRLGGVNYAECILYSLNFADIKAIGDRKDWPALLELMTGISRKLIGAGAEGIMLCANTLHLVADDLRRRIDVPIVHIAEATAEAIQQRGQKKIGLLGTRFTMEMDFFKNKLADRGIETVVPGDADRGFIHDSIFQELGKNIFEDRTKRRYLGILDDLSKAGAEGMVLGCTEIPLLIKQTDTAIPLFDTVRIHVDAGVKFALDP